MATTTNYGWGTPDDTDLVKDGALAIRDLGQDIDTTTKALNPSTTLGDIEYRSATANTNTRLAIGSTGNVLTVTGGVPVWAAPSGGGGMTLLSTTTLSGTSTTVSTINQTYKNLFIEVENATWDTADDSPAFTTNISGGVYSVKNLAPTAVTTRSLLSTVTEIDDVNQSAKRTGGNNYYAFTFNDYASTTNHKSFTIMGSYEGSAISRIAALFGSIASNTAIDSFTFSTTNNRNMTAGTIKVYGVK